MMSDSIEKIVTRYFATLTREPFTFNGKRYDPKPLKVSPLLLRDYTCPPGCGGCCFKFTLDYLPSEDKPPGATKRYVEFDGRQVEIWTDSQEANDTGRCQHLQRETGRCGIYTVRPFTCDFELIRTLQPVEPNSPRPNILTQKLFGRGWSYPRVDGGKGALCEMTPITRKSVKEVIRKIIRLRQWADHFEVHTWADKLLLLIESGTLQRAEGSVVFDPSEKTAYRRGFGL